MAPDFNIRDIFECIDHFSDLLDQIFLSADGGIIFYLNNTDMSTLANLLIIIILIIITPNLHP